MTRKCKKEWEAEEELSSWLSEDPLQPNRAYCKTCKINMQSKKHILLKHARSNSHMRETCALNETNDPKMSLENDSRSDAKQTKENDKHNPNSESLEKMTISESEESMETALIENSQEESEVENKILSLDTEKNEQFLDNEFGKQKYQRTYKTEWENLYSWLQADECSRTRAKCKICQYSIIANITALNNHSKSKKHILNEGIQDILSDFDREKASLEIELVAFLVENNLPFSLADRMVPFLKRRIKDSEKIKKITLDRKKVTQILKNVFVPVHKEKLKNILKNKKFCILVDESTDISSQHNIDASCS